MTQEQVIQGVFLHVRLSNTSGGRFLLVFLELLHGNMNSFTTWLLLNFSSVQLNFVVHAGKTLHRRCSTSTGVVAVPLTHLGGTLRLGSVGGSTSLILASNSLF